MLPDLLVTAAVLSKAYTMLSPNDTRRRGDDGGCSRGHAITSEEKDSLRDAAWAAALAARVAEGDAIEDEEAGGEWRVLNPP